MNLAIVLVYTIMFNGDGDLDTISRCARHTFRVCVSDHNASFDKKKRNCYLQHKSIIIMVPWKTKQMKMTGKKGASRNDIVSKVQNCLLLQLNKLRQSMTTRRRQSLHTFSRNYHALAILTSWNGLNSSGDAVCVCV